MAGLNFGGQVTVIIDAFHDIVKAFGPQLARGGRINKEYVCYLPGKKTDGDLNPKILLMKDTVPGQVPTKIKMELGAMLKTQKVKSVLIIGDSRSCQESLLELAKKLKIIGFRYVDHRSLSEAKFSFKQWLIAGYRVLAKRSNDVLAWRILIGGLSPVDRKSLILKSFGKPDQFVSSVPESFKQAHARHAGVLQKVLTKSPSEVRQIGDSTMEKLFQEVLEGQKTDREVLVDQLIAENKTLPRPLGSLDITVCNILGSKGLGADVVFLIGFDQGRLPAKNDPTDSEIYQFLVALTRAKKRIYLIHTGRKQISKFLGHIKPERYAEVPAASR